MNPLLPLLPSRNWLSSWIFMLKRNVKHSSDYLMSNEPRRDVKWVVLLMFKFMWRNTEVYCGLLKLIFLLKDNRQGKRQILSSMSSSSPKTLTRLDRWSQKFYIFRCTTEGKLNQIENFLNFFKTPHTFNSSVSMKDVIAI